jgi:hypothetical protein
MRPFSIALRQHSENREKMRDALPSGHLGDHLIGLIGSDVHLDVGSGLKQFSHSGKFSDSAEEALMDFIQPVFFRGRQHHGTFVEPPCCVKLAVLDSQPTHTNSIYQQFFQGRWLRSQQLGAYAFDFPCDDLLAHQILSTEGVRPRFFRLMCQDTAVLPQFRDLVEEGSDQG